jgi:ribosomal protein L40E
VEPAALPPAVPPDQPAARLPIAPTAQPRQAAAAAVREHQPQPGDRICGNCGAANDAARKFCRRCGTTLLNAEVVGAKKVPWWRRIFRRRPKQYAAGERTKAMQAGGSRSTGRGSRVSRIIQGVIGLLLIASISGYVVVPTFRQAVNSAASTAVSQLSHLINPKLVPVRPVTVTSNDQVSGHPASQMFDTYANTDWRANGQQPKVVVGFDHSFDLGALIVHAGAADKFTDTRRPSKLQLTFPDGTTTVIDLEDDNKAQTINVDKSGIDGFTLEVLSSYGPTSAPVVISEIEVFAKE